MVKHHAPAAEGSDRPIGVVLPNEEIMLCREGDANRGAGGPDWAGQKSFLHMKRHSPWN